MQSTCDSIFLGFDVTTYVATRDFTYDKDYAEARREVYVATQAIVAGLVSGELIAAGLALGAHEHV